MRKRTLLFLVFLGGAGGMALGAALAGMGPGRERVFQTEDALVTGIGGVFFKARDPGLAERVSRPPAT